MNYEFTGATIEEAIAQGLKELNLTEDEVEIETINHGGFLSNAVVKITPKDSATAYEDNQAEVQKEIPQEVVDKSAQFVQGLIDNFDLDLEVNTVCNGDGILHTINGSKSNAVIGYRGEVLDSIQYLALLVANKDNNEDFVRISLDAGSYREKRKETLKNLASRLAQKAIDNERRVKIEPMNPYERRIMHFALQDNPHVTTVSEGEGKYRHVVIIPNEEKFSYGTSNFSKRGLGKTRKFGYSKKY